jgi:hypothetical protein
MSDEAPTTEQQPAETAGYTPPATQEDLNKIIDERLKRERSKFADYSDLKSKASQFDELAEAQTSETQKALERAEAAERALTEARTESLRLSVIAKHQIPEDYHDFIVGADADELEAKAQKVQALITAQQEQPNSRQTLLVPAEGRSPDQALNGDPLLASLKSKLGIN